MNKKQLAAFARSKGWQGDDARTPLAAIVAWLTQRGIDVAAVATPQPAPIHTATAAPAPVAAPAIQGEPQPAPSQAIAIDLTPEWTQPAPHPLNMFEAYIEKKVADMLDAYASVIGAQPQQPAMDATAVHSAVMDSLRSLIPTPADSPVTLPHDMARSLIADSATLESASTVFKGAVRSLADGHSVRCMPSTQRHASTPQIDPLYQFDTNALTHALICDAMQPHAGHLWLAGPKGAGKTQFAAQYAARTNRPFFRINFEGTMERYELVGGRQLEAGSSIWQDGILTQAIQVPHAVILLDEPTFGRAHNNATLHPLLERNGCLPIAETGRVVRPAPGILFILADNTMGQGDASGRYAGTTEQNGALLDRMAYIISLTPPSATVEARLLATRTGIAKDAATLVAKFSQHCRRANESGSLVDAVSLRQTEAFCHAIKGGIPAQDAFDSSIVNKAPIECAEALQQLFAAHLGDTLRTLLGQPLAAAQPAVDPSMDATDSEVTL